MDIDKYDESLKRLKKGEDGGEELADGGVLDMENVPLNGFFGDDFLSLLYRSSSPPRESLEYIMVQLRIVADESQPLRRRARSAIHIGTFVEARCGEGGGPGTSRPADWFGLAKDWGSIMGVTAHTQHILALHGAHIQFELKLSPFPKFVVEPPRAVIGEAAGLWAEGVRLACQHAPDGFPGWTSEELHYALSCVVNYLVLMPPQFAKTNTEKTVQTRIDALQWMRPVWNCLIDSIASKARKPEKTLNDLKAQQAAILLYLRDSAETSQQQAEMHVYSADLAAAAQAVPAQGSVVLMKQKFAESSDRSEAAILSQFGILHEPLKLVTLPPPDKLLGIRKTLEAEFPWALGAIDTIMVDLTARQRFGATRLGMWPILMVGNPGTGKTRLAQRLSELLGTPNTVINMAGMRDTNTFKGVSRGWSGSRPSRMVEFIQQTKTPNPLFVLDELDKTGRAYSNSGNPLDALLDLLETCNAKRFQDVFLMTEVDLSHCLYIGTANSLDPIPEPLLSRLRLVYVPPPRPEHTEVIAKGVLRDIEQHWGLPAETLWLSPKELASLVGLGPREMRQAMISHFGGKENPGVMVH